MTVVSRNAAPTVLCLRTNTTRTRPFPLLEVDGRRRVARLQTDHARLHLGRRPEVVLADLKVQGRGDRDGAVQWKEDTNNARASQLTTR